MDKLKEKKIKNPDYWVRLLLVLLYFGLVFYLVRALVGIALVLQFVIVALSGKTNHRVVHFTGNLNQFSYHVLQYVTWNTDNRPFPFSDWPGPIDRDSDSFKS